MQKTSPAVFVSAKPLLKKLGLLLCFAGLLYLLYWQLTQNRQFALSELWAAWQRTAQAGAWGWLLGFAALVPLNWLMEVWKWQAVFVPQTPISTRRAVAAVLAGLTVSLFTPNRVGEYGGRMLFVGASDREQAVLSTLLGNWAQWLAIFWAGWAALALAWGAGFWGGELAVAWRWAILALGAALGILGGLLYQNAFRFLGRVASWRWAARWMRPLLPMLENPNPRARLGLVFRLSLGRFAVYSAQYFCLFQCFGLPLGALETVAAIGLIFALQTGIPLPPATGLVARGNLSLWVVSGLVAPMFLAEASVACLAATLALWLGNVFLPACGGAGCLLLWGGRWQRLR